jgi:hypothetical protein
VSRAVGDDEPPRRRLEVAIRDVDRDPLFALRTQTVGEQRKVNLDFAPSPGYLGDMLKLVFEHLL